MSERIPRKGLLMHAWVNFVRNRMECSTCGTSQPFDVPLSMEELGNLSIQFYNEHKTCSLAEPQPEEEATHG
jgi:hypothetical protein